MASPGEYLAWALVLVLGYLANRNRNMQKAYRELIADLRSEIDRLKAEVQELRNLLTPRSRSRTPGKSQKSSGVSS